MDGTVYLYSEVPKGSRAKRSVPIIIKKRFKKKSLIGNP